VGSVGTRDGVVRRIRAGDTVVCPPDEDHWHGAAADRFMSHLAMLEAESEGSDPTTWLEPLPDDEYRTAGAR
jgi:quercetin dioxygenase-like cupin family protein